MKTVLLAVLLVLSLSLGVIAPAFAGPPEPPGFTLDAKSIEVFAEQYEVVKQAILEMPWSQDKRELLTLLDSANMKLYCAKTAADLMKAWMMLGRVSALVAEAQRYAAAGASNAPKGVFIAAPLYFACTMTSYPSLRGYTLTCPATRYTKSKTYWCQGLRCQEYWRNQ